MKRCGYCKDKFEGKNPKSIYCSTKCRVYGNRVKKKAAPPKKSNPKIKSVEKIMKSAIAGPKTLKELRELCPSDLSGLERSKWVSEHRKLYNI